MTRTMMFLIVAVTTLLSACGTIVDTESHVAPENALLVSGEIFPDFVAVDQFGTEFELSSFAGTPVLVHFCAIWCLPCRQFAAGLVELEAELSATFGSESFVILEALIEDNSGFPTDARDAAAWAELVIGDGARSVLHLASGAYPEASTVFDSLGTSTFPTFAVLGPDRELLATHVGAWSTVGEAAAFLAEKWAPYLLSPEAKLGTLIGLVRDAADGDAVVGSLVPTLERALMLITEGQMDPAIAMLEAFAERIGGLAGHKLDPGMVEAWSAAIREIVELLSGSA